MYIESSSRAGYEASNLAAQVCARNVALLLLVSLQLLLVNHFLSWSR